MGAITSKETVRRVSSIFGDRIECAISKELDEQKMRYQPESLERLTQETNFTKNELKFLYQSFKQNCPSGFVTKAQFVTIFRQFFAIHRLSDAKPYAEMVFNTFDDDGNGRISFSEFAQEFSMFHKGSTEEKLDWLFDLYDVSRRGFIIEEDFQKVFIAMYALIGIHYLKEKHIPILLRRRIKQQFVKLDTNRDGKITRAEFLDGCQADVQILESLERLKTIW